MKKIALLLGLLGLFCFFQPALKFLNNPAHALTRPPSEACSFKAEIMDYEDVTNKIVVNNIEEYKFHLRILESNAPLWPKILSHKEAERACSELENQIIESSWYLARNETGVDKNKVLLRGSVITGEIDSLDHIIKKISVVSEGSSEDQESTNQRNWIVAILVAIFIIIVAGLLIKKNMLKNQQE